MQRLDEAPTPIAADVRAGLAASRKRLPPYLFYDDEGSRLYEEITRLPEYYLTRTERAILEQYADEMVARASREDGGGGEGPHRGGHGGLRVIELGAGSATKTELVLRAAQRRHGRCTYVPIDVSQSTLAAAAERLVRELPGLEVTPYAMPHAEALRRLRPTEEPDLVLFIGSSVGNFEDDEATLLLASVARSLGPRTSLLLGTDLRKDAGVLVRAYDDSKGVTAAFNKNLLVRLNREFGADFDLGRFRHVARWNERESRIEMHLESAGAQTVRLPALGTTVSFAPNETIHTESSIKYDLPRVERMLRGGGFTLERTYHDSERRFAVHLATADAARRPTAPTR